MKSADFTTTREEARSAMMQAPKDNNPEAYSAAFEQMMNVVADSVRSEFEQSLAEHQEEADNKILSTRGVRQLTSKEKEFYQKLIESGNSDYPKQALTNMNLALPETVINAVFEDLRTRHPLLSRIDFLPVNANIRMLMNTNGYEMATWGDLCDEIVKEATAGLVEVDSALHKLSAFLLMCKQMLGLGPAWIDNFAREVLYEMFANGLEYGIVTGTGKKMPIGMDRQVGEGVVVTSGVYPQKEKVAITNFTIQALGNLISTMAVDDYGKNRRIDNLILIVSPADYYAKIVPAIYIMAPDGTWRSTLPYPIEVIQSPAVEIGEAILGMAHRYFAAAGSSTDGNIEYSDHAKFIEDQRVYIIKGFATGTPKDNKSFIRLDITGVVPPVFKFENVTFVPSTDATLASLKIGNLTLDPEFDPSEDEYEAETTNASNTITATAADAGATIVIDVDDTIIQNGTAYTWETGDNVVTVTVTAEDGETTETYTVTVTKS